MLESDLYYSEEIKRRMLDLLLYQKHKYDYLFE